MSALRKTPVVSTEYGSPLDEADFAALEKSYISAQVAASALLRRVTSEEGKAIVGRRDFEDYAGIVFPYHFPGQPGARAHRIRRDNPPITIKRGVQKQDTKYVSAPGWGNPLYFHPDTLAAALADTTVDLYITEGQKKCLALYGLFREAGMTAQPVAINGVWGHRGKTGIGTNGNGKRVPQKGPIPDLDLLVWTGRKVVIVFDPNVTTDTMVAAARNELALELTGRGAKVDFIDMEPEPNVNGVDDYLWLHGPEAGLDLLASARPFDPSEKIAKLPYTDYGNEQAFEYLHGKEFLYNFTSRLWLRWDGNVWAPDLVRQVDRAILAVAIVRKDSAAKAADEKTRKAALASAFELQNMQGRKSALESAQSNPTFRKRAEDFDQHELLFACRNGVLDLATGKFDSGRRGDLLTMKTTVEYNAGATCSKWLKFLGEVFPEKPDEMIAFLKRAVGYSLTALTREEVFFILHGRGRNGKGTFLRVLSEVLGDHAYNTEFSTLIADPRNARSPRNDIAAMAGKRFVTAQESKEGARLDESLIKTLTGGDLITARFLHKEFFTFRPTWKIWLATNHRPEIQGTDDGIWSRPRLIPFAVSFEGREDKELKARLMEPDELSGILRWAVEGCSEYLKNGLAYPAAVTQATAEYKADSDVLQRFVEEWCDVASNFSSRSHDLYQAYTKWATGTGETPMTETMFGRRMPEKGFERTRDDRGAKYAGIAVRKADNRASDEY